MKPYALILSNDVQDAESMLGVTELAAPYIDGIKIGITSSMKPGIDVLRRAKEIMGDKPVAVFADYKVADIGFQGKDGWQGTNEKIVRELAEAGADYITVHTFPGLSSIEEAVTTAHAHDAKVLTLPYI